ncbi:MAG: hypothetical protein K2G55_03080 [Lachnospiraceae bacterium]|nr:hypothetical protein [Lachnospiraceae bacterium]
MEFIILPLSYRTKEEKQEKIRETVELAVKIKDRKQQIFTLAGILVFTDKVIDRETASKIRRAIQMTQVAQIFEEEKQQALLQAAQTFEEDKQQSIQDIAKRMIEQGYSTDEITILIPIYSRNDIDQLREKIAKNDN